MKAGELRPGQKFRFVGYGAELFGDDVFILAGEWRGFLEVANTGTNDLCGRLMLPPNCSYEVVLVKEVQEP